LVSGDIVAFYPNINVQKAIDIAAMLYAEDKHGNNIDNASEEMLKEERVFLECLSIGNKNLLLQFEDKYY
jgi:hypothetical protein